MERRGLLNGQQQVVSAAEVRSSVGRGQLSSALPPIDEENVQTTARGLEPSEHDTFVKRKIDRVRRPHRRLISTFSNGAVEGKLVSFFQVPSLTVARRTYSARTVRLRSGHRYPTRP